MTPLHFAVDLSNFDVAEILIRYGADVNARGNVSKITLLLYLLLTASARASIELLIRSGADVNVRNDVSTLTS